MCVESGYKMGCDALQKLTHGKLTLCEYNEITSCIREMWIEKKNITTVSLTVAEFMASYGVRVLPDGIGWRMSWDGRM